MRYVGGQVIVDAMLFRRTRKTGNQLVEMYQAFPEVRTNLQANSSREVNLHV